MKVIYVVNPDNPMKGNNCSLNDGNGCYLENSPCDLGKVKIVRNIPRSLGRTLIEKVISLI